MTGPYLHTSVKPNVLFMSDHLGHPEGRLHGASTYFLNVLPLLCRQDGPVTVCFLRGHHPVAARLEECGVQPLFLGRSKQDPRAARDIVRLVRENSINIVHAAGLKGILVGRWAARKTGVSCIAHLHDANPAGALASLLHRRTADWDDCCICISRAVAQYGTAILGIPAARMAVLHNPLPPNAGEPADPFLVESLRRDWALMGKHVLLVLGRLSPEKGHALLIEQGANWLRNHPDTVLWIVGEGEERPRLERLIAHVRLETQVLLAGQQENIPAVLQTADTVLIPSLQEGLSYVALEAMASGCPVAAFAVGGVPEIIEHERNGLLAAPSSIGQLLQQVDRYREDPVLRRKIILEARHSVAGRTVDTHVQDLFDVYQSVLEDRLAAKG